MKLSFIPKKKNSILPFCQQSIILFLGLILLFYILVIGSNDRDRFLAVHCCETNMCNAGHRSSTGGRAALALLLATSFRFFFFFFRYWSRGLSPAAAAAATPHHIFSSSSLFVTFISISPSLSLFLFVCVCVWYTKPAFRNNFWPALCFISLLPTNPHETGILLRGKIEGKRERRRREKKKRLACHWAVCSDWMNKECAS